MGNRAIRHSGIALDKPGLGNYLYRMNIIRRTLEIDTDASLTEMAAQHGRDVAAVLAEAVVLLDSVIERAGPDIAENRRRLDEFLLSREALPARRDELRLSRILPS